MLKKVLVVDDEPLILLTLRELLESHGIEVLTAGGGTECLEIMESGFKGVVLMDIMMPKMDGWDTITEIVDRGLLEGNIISMLTAKDVPDQKMEELKECVMDYITKPFDPGELVATVKDYLTYL